MRRLVLAAGLGLAAAAVSMLPARAEHFDMQLSVRSSKGIAEASWDTSPPEGGFNPRQVVEAAAGEDLLLKWRSRSEFPHGPMKAVRTHLFVVRQKEIGQKPLPPAGTPHVLDNIFTVDFLPHHSAYGHLHFRVTEPGNYLVRLESEETLEEHNHEHFAALDLLVR
jgi:hypothetical protein